MKISVIVPIHGVEKYLRKCLRTLLEQDFSYSYEVICVNDNPNDSCPSIIDEFIDLAPSIFKRFDVNNRNISFTRNDGIKVSKGEYITFVDGDDFVNKNFLSTLYKEALRSEADIVVSNYYGYKNRKINIFTSNFAAKGVYDNKKALSKLFNDVSCRGYVWGKLFKRELILENKLEFIDVKETSEDVLFTYMSFLHASKVSFIRDRLYFYVMRDDSITSTWNKFNAAQMVLNSLALMKLYSLKIKGDGKGYFNFSTFSKKFLIRYYLLFAKSNTYTKHEINECVKNQFKIITQDISIEGMPWEKAAKSSHLFDDIKNLKNEKNVDVFDISKT